MIQALYPPEVRDEELVAPAQAGAQKDLEELDSRLRGNDLQGGEITINGQRTPVFIGFQTLFLFRSSTCFIIPSSRVT
jgi:hypothetical protein